MKKIIITLSILILGGSLIAQNSLYDFTVTDINGNDFALSQLAGKKVMVVNTASKCGLTPQYEDLERLYKEYSEKDFFIIGFPANNFMGQEPGTNEEIKQFCREKYHVSFPMMSKISVKGDDMHALYRWLTSSDLNGKEDSEVTWNFQKYLIDDKGQLVAHHTPRTKPFDKDIIDWIEH